MPSSERGQIRGVEGFLGALALHGYGLLAASQEDKVDLVMRLVAPIVDGESGAVSMNLIEKEMLEKVTHIVGSELAPPAMVGDEAGIEPEDARGGDDFRGPACGIWAEPSASA